MKRFLVIAVAAFLLPVSLWAQRTVQEAALTYRIGVEGQSSALMKDASLTVFVKGNLSRTDMVSNLGTETTIFDHKSGKGVVLKEYSGQKLMITMTRDNWEQKNQLMHNMVFVEAKPGEKIGDFTCSRANGKTNDGRQVSVCYMPDIILTNNTYANAFGKLKGIPVQYELEAGKSKFTYTLSNISYEPVPVSRFDIPTSGYRVMTYEENLQLKRG